MAKIKWKTSDDLLTEKRNLKIEELKKACSEAVYAGFASTIGHEFGFNEHDQANFTQQMLLILNGNTAPIHWKTKNAGVVTLTLEEFNTVIEDSKNHKITQQQKFWQLEAQAKAAISEAELNLISWS